MVNSTAVFQAVDVKFKENTDVGQKTFVIMDNSLGNCVTYFERCTFDIKGIAVDMRAVVAVNTGNFGTAELQFFDCTFNNGASFQTDRAKKITISGKFNGGWITESNVLDLRLTVEMRGNWASVGVKVTNVVGTNFSGFIDNYSLAGIDASSGINGFIGLMSSSTIQNCYYGIHMNGGLNHPYDTDFGYSTN